MRTPIAITTSVLEDLHNDGASQWIMTTVLCNDGSIWEFDGNHGVWFELPPIPAFDGLIVPDSEMTPAERHELLTPRTFGNEPL